MQNTGQTAEFLFIYLWMSIAFRRLIALKILQFTILAPFIPCISTLMEANAQDGDPIQNVHNDFNLSDDWLVCH